MREKVELFKSMGFTTGGGKMLSLHLVPLSDVPVRHSPHFCYNDYQALQLVSCAYN